MSQAKKKDPLFAGLARSARVLNIPVEIFTWFFVIGGVIFAILALISQIKIAIILFILTYFFLFVATYQDDRGLHFYGFAIKRFFTRKKIFDGYSFDPNLKVNTKNHGNSYSFQKIANEEAMEISNFEYLSHINPHDIKLATGDIFTILKISGFSYETKSYEQLKALKQYRADMFRQLGSRFVINIYYDRFEADERHPPKTGNEFVDQFNSRYYKKLTSEKVFQNDIYISLLVRRTSPSDPLLTRLKHTFFRDDNEEQMLAELDNAVSMFEEYLQDAKPKRLGIYQREGANYSETVNFLSYLTNLEKVEVPLYPTEIRNYLSFARKVFMPDGTIKFHHPSGEVSAGAIFSLPNATYPENSDHTMLDAFLKVDHPLIISQTFMMMDRKHSVDLTVKRQNQLINAKDKAGSQTEAMTQAIDDLASGRSLNGLFTFNVLVSAKTGQAFKDAMQKTRGAFQIARMLPVKEDLVAEPSFYSMLVGNYHKIQRPATINTTNFAGFASLHNNAKGKASGNHWGMSVLPLKTISNTLYDFNFHENDVGHTRITTGTGGGKTTLINALLTSSAKFNPYIFHFDFEYSASIWIQAMGGKHTVLSEIIPTGWNPLCLDDNEQNRLFFRNLFAFMGQSYNDLGQAIALTTFEENKIKDVVDSIFEYDIQVRRLRNFVSAFGIAENNNLAERLSKWVGDGAYANIFDNETDSFSIEGARIFGYEMKNVIDNDVVLGAMSMYIFHRIDIAMSKAEPFIVVVEEGQKYISNPINLKWLKTMLTTYRRRNGMMIFVTPTPEVITQDPDLISQFKTSILLPNDKANASTYMGNEMNNGLGCTQAEFDWVINTSPKLREFMVKNSHDSVISKLDLSNMPEMIPILSGNEFRHNILSHIINQHSDHSYSTWIHQFNEKIQHENR